MNPWSCLIKAIPLEINSVPIFSTLNKSPSWGLLIYQLLISTIVSQRKNIKVKQR